MPIHETETRHKLMKTSYIVKPYSSPFSRLIFTLSGTDDDDEDPVTRSKRCGKTATPLAAAAAPLILMRRNFSQQPRPLSLKTVQDVSFSNNK